jgi:DNA mismatch endonuclease (patch repair protein)
VLVHGCFWHGHSCRAGKNRPVSHSEYWNAKLERNMTRDRRNIARLRRDGWGVLTVWECQVSSAALPLRLKKFLESK